MCNFSCNICGEKFDTILTLSRHNSRKHKINAEETYIIYVLNGIRPTCKCGCGKNPKFLSVIKGYNSYVPGHASKINNNWGHNKEALKKSHETQKKLYKSGELKIWNKGLNKDLDVRVKKYGQSISNNKERGLKISKTNSGVKKSKEHKEKLKINAIKRWSNQEEREKQRKRKIKYLETTNFKNKKTKLEKTFENILKSLKIKYEYQYKYHDYHFDFYLNDYDILIEVNGDFFHCNPNTKHKEPYYPIQKQTIYNDNNKKILCQKTNKKLFYFWECDINNKAEDIIEQLKKGLEL